MIIKNVELINFRNYDTLNLEFNKNINIFIGKNGMGKTNILEAIYFLAITKSHRTSNDRKMILEGKKGTKVKGIIKKEGYLNKALEIMLSETKKEVKIDSDEIKKLSLYISNMNVILFSPEIIEILKGSPSERRKFLNIEIGQINSRYLREVNIYNNLLKIRNEYLKNINNKKVIDEAYFDIITDKLINSAIYIYKTRQEFIGRINMYIVGIYKNIATSGNLRLRYMVNFDNFESETIREYLKTKLYNNLKNEIEQGTTMYGPHRDDFLMVLNDKDLKSYGSQGQQRIALLALKLAEIRIFKDKTGTNPILLLDDIFSELDKYKKKNILDYIIDDIQVFITATDISKKSLHNANIYHVTNGKITKYEEVK